MKLPTDRKSTASGTYSELRQNKVQAQRAAEMHDLWENTQKSREQEINTNIYVTMKGTEEEMQLSRKSIKKRVIQKNTHSSTKCNYSDRK